MSWIGILLVCGCPVFTLLFALFLLTVITAMCHPPLVIRHVSPQSCWPSHVSPASCHPSHVSPESCWHHMGDLCRYLSRGTCVLLHITCHLRLVDITCFTYVFLLITCHLRFVDITCFTYVLLTSHVSPVSCWPVHLSPSAPICLCQFVVLLLLIAFIKSLCVQSDVPTCRRNCVPCLRLSAKTVV